MTDRVLAILSQGREATSRTWSRLRNQLHDRILHDSTETSSAGRHSIKTKAPLTPVRVAGRSFEQPSPEVCSIPTLDYVPNFVNSSGVPPGGTTELVPLQ